MMLSKTNPNSNVTTSLVSCSGEVYVYLQRSRDGSNLGAAPQNHQNLKWDGYGWFTTKNGPTSVSGPLDLKY